MPVLHTRNLRLVLGLAFSTPIPSLVSSVASASSHREAPEISRDPAADLTDVYAFKSPGTTDHVTLIANVYPSSPVSGPNWYLLDDDVMYEINIDTKGDGKPDVSYQFMVKTNITKGLPIAYLCPPPNLIPVAFENGKYCQAINQTYTLSKVVNRRDQVIVQDAPIAPARVGPKTTNPDANGLVFEGNHDDNYAALANNAVQSPNGYRVFVGPRADPFYIDLGAIFDTVHLAEIITKKIPPVNSQLHQWVYSLVMDVPISEIFPAGAKSRIMGVWAATYRRQSGWRRGFDRDDRYPRQFVGGGGWVQVQRLGNPLVNEVLINVDRKDKWGQSPPQNDQQFDNDIQNPVLAVGINALFSGAGLKAVRSSKRTDLTQILHHGVPNLNLLSLNNVSADELRFNFDAPFQSYPNGRQLTDNVLDLILRVFAECDVYEAVGSIYGVPAAAVQSLLKLPNNPLGTSDYPAGTLNCQLTDGLSPADITANAGEQAIHVSSENDFPYLGLPYSNFPASRYPGH